MSQFDKFLNMTSVLIPDTPDNCKHFLSMLLKKKEEVSFNDFLINLLDKFLFLHTSSI